MAKDRRYKAKVTVRFSKRDDGGLQASCDAVHGFFLSGNDPRAVMRDVVPTLEGLLKHNVGVDVSAFPLKYGIYGMLERDTPIDEQIPDEQDYVLERVAA